MPISYALHRDGKPTGRKVTVPEPRELQGRNPQMTRKMQNRQQRLISNLDRCQKWQRAGAAPAPVEQGQKVDVEALVAARVAEELAKREAADDKPSPRRRTRKSADETPVAE